MKNLLIINASPRGERSVTRDLTKLFATKWMEANPDYTIHHREVGREPIPHVSELWISATFKPAELRTEEEIDILKISDMYIAEIKAADVIVLGTPMYNWSIPSVLKAYLDQVIRANETVKMRPDDPKNPYRGLLKDKKVYLLFSRGNAGYERDEYYAHMNFQTEYLKTVFKIMGLTDIQEIALNGSAFDQEVYEQSKKDVYSKIAEMASNDKIIA
ncbi:NAD(P)H-dependent oxidoreductase [Mucilaginibacter sabulilitoris]|uniref:FMN dependent NADH:quinone oxidoreductase n=1 Tax=Mucilaginibacter sabulilitoris TaxID=1173583 RepID=A0ABZ0TZN2_9SPHI|nr:NAD(P)H-dependent oxidoreductase [Mucilaginibacter sabulilitoris]WPU96995.1 NAD(P)H-dependent oxidoreductase [Mucilaginibacter sabulilitoris]